MKKATILILITCFYFNGVCQETKNPKTLSKELAEDSIKIERKSGAYLFTLHGEEITFRKMLVLMNNNPQSYNYLQKANSAVALGRVVTFAGGFMIGYSLSPILRGENINLGLTLLGGLVSVVSIPIRLSAYKNIHKAVVIYNSGITESEKVMYDINIGVNNNGLALSIRF